MIVLDASAAVHVLLRSAVGEALLPRVATEDMRVPELFEYEVVAALRSAVARGDISDRRAGMAVADLGALTLTRYPPHALIDRIWALRRTLTAYDAAYVALAEALPAPLVTADARLARAHGHTAVVELCTS